MLGSSASSPTLPPKHTLSLSAQTISTALSTSVHSACTDVRGVVDGAARGRGVGRGSVDADGNNIGSDGRVRLRYLGGL